MAAVLSESVLDRNGPKWSKRPFFEQNKNTANGNTASENLVVFLCWEISAQGVSKNMVGNCVLIFYGSLPALNFHLRCYRLRCFGFVRILVKLTLFRTGF